MSQIALEEPFPLYAIPRVWAWAREFRDKVSDDFGPQSIEDFLEQWIAATARNRTSWAVLRGGEIGGLIYSDRLSPVVADVHVIFKREFWGQKTTVAALNLACVEIFESGADKIETTIFKDNRAALSMGAAAGFKREGLLLGHTLRAGKQADVVVVGLQRSVFDGIHNRRVQQQQDEQPVSKLDDRVLGHKPEPLTRAGADGAGHIRDAPSLPHGPRGGGQPGQNGSTEPSQSELLRAG